MPRRGGSESRSARETLARVAQDFRANGEVEVTLAADKGAHRGVGNDVAEILGVVNGARRGARDRP